MRKPSVGWRLLWACIGIILGYWAGMLLAATVGVLVFFATSWEPGATGVGLVLLFSSMTVGGVWGWRRPPMRW